MRYLCVHCDKAFEHENEAKKPRCPTCMRVNGLEKVKDTPKTSAETQRPWIMWAIAAGVLAAAGVGYAVWASEAPPAVGSRVPLQPLDRETVLAHLRREGVDARELNDLLVPSEDVAAWAERTAGSAGDAQGKARAIQRAIRARAAAGAFARWSLGVPRETQIGSDEHTLDWIGEDRARRQLYPLEVAVLMANALRSLDVNAMVAEVIRFPGERSPPDPSGQFGYFVVAVYDGEAGEGDPEYYDPYQGRSTEPEARVLNDLQAIGDALGHKALHYLSRESDPERAIEASGHALALDERSPALRAVRGAVLVAAGQLPEGLRELEDAKQLRTDAPRRNLLAGVHMAQGDFDAAQAEISAALEEYPDFAPGRATLAAIHLSRQETDLALHELQEAERADPQLHTLPQLWAGYYATTGDLDRAITYASDSVERNPGDLQARLMAARIYRQAGRYELMRREAREVIARTPPARQAEMRLLIRQILGPTALEDDEEEELEEEEEELAEAEDEEIEAEPGSMQLESPMLGTGRDRGPSLLGEEGQLQGGPPGPGGLQLGGGAREGPSLDMNE